MGKLFQYRKLTLNFREYLRLRVFHESTALIKVLTPSMSMLLFLDSIPQNKFLHYADTIHYVHSRFKAVIVDGERTFYDLGNNMVEKKG